ncbi:MAG TPA: tetratricopeptide repeat protein [Thermoanaerobaculia bacterium]
MEEMNPPDKTARGVGEELSRQEAQEIVRRMLAGAPKSSSSVPVLAAWRRNGNGEAQYDEAFRRTERRLAEAHDRVRRERQTALNQWSVLEGHPPARRLVMVRNDERLHHWGLYNLVVEKSREQACLDAAAAVHFAEMAVAVAERLDPEVYGDERVADFKTSALVALGDARRLTGDLAGARLAFSHARVNQEMGTGDLLEEANLLGGLVSLLCDLGEFEKAARSLERATALYRRLGDAHHLDGIQVPNRVEDIGEIRQDQRAV